MGTSLRINYIKKDWLCMVFYEEIAVKTGRRDHWIEITSQVKSVIEQLPITKGIVTVTSNHTTAGMTINENADPDVETDFFWKLRKLVPEHSEFLHGEGNSDSHIKASLMGLSVQIPLVDGALKLGVWQGIYFCEFDGPRKRSVSITIIGE